MTFHDDPDHNDPDGVDVGTIAAVPPDQQLDVDGGDDSDALADGDDTDDLDEIRANPGEPWDGT